MSYVPCYYSDLWTPLGHWLFFRLMFVHRDRGPRGCHTWDGLCRASPRSVRSGSEALISGQGLFHRQARAVVLGQQHGTRDPVKPGVKTSGPLRHSSKRRKRLYFSQKARGLCREISPFGKISVKSPYSFYFLNRKQISRFRVSTTTLVFQEFPSAFSMHLDKASPSLQPPWKGRKGLGQNPCCYFLLFHGPCCYFPCADLPFLLCGLEG